MQSMGLKPWEDNDREEGKQIAATFAVMRKTNIVMVQSRAQSRRNNSILDGSMRAES